MNNNSLLNNLYYAAGLFDGEGSFIIRRNKKYGHAGAKISMNNTSYELLEFMKSIFGGNIYQDKMPRKKVNWQWSIQAKSDIVNFIDLVLPLLREKEKIRRGKILLEFCNATTKEQKLNFLENFFLTN